MASMPIHEIIKGRNDCIKQFYWKLWYGEGYGLRNCHRLATSLSMISLSTSLKSVQSTSSACHHVT